MHPIQFSGVKILRLANMSKQSYDESQELADRYRKNLAHSAMFRLEDNEHTTYMIYGKDLGAMAQQAFGFEIADDVCLATREQAKADADLDKRIGESMDKFHEQVAALGANAFVQKVADYANGLLKTEKKLDAEGQPVTEQFCTGFGAISIKPKD